MKTNRKVYAFRSYEFTVINGFADLDLVARQLASEKPHCKHQADSHFLPSERGEPAAYSRWDSSLRMVKVDLQAVLAGTKKKTGCLLF